MIQLKKRNGKLPKRQTTVRILIVEDNIIDSTTLKRIIEEQSGPGIVTVVETLEEMLKVNIKEYDLALVDLNLPDSSAEETINKLSYFSIPVAVISGHGNGDISEQVGRKLGLPVMIKPSSRLDIESVARNIIGMAEFKQKQERELEELRSLKIFKTEQ